MWVLGNFCFTCNIQLFIYNENIIVYYLCNYSCLNWHAVKWDKDNTVKAWESVLEADQTQM